VGVGDGKEMRIEKIGVETGVGEDGKGTAERAEPLVC